MVGQKQKGVLLIQLGTPDQPTVVGVRRYLKQFLSDRNVIQLPAFLRYLLLYLVILPFRPKRSAHAYQQIWTERGSPLLIHSQELAAKLQAQLGSSFKVILGMRYGNPSLDHALDEVSNSNLESLVAIPLYPQYSRATTGSSIEELNRLFQKRGLHHVLPLKILRDFFVPEFEQGRLFVEPLVKLIGENLSQDQKPEHWLLSFHGLPELQIKRENPQLCLTRSDCCATLSEANQKCYRAQCFETARLIAKHAGWNPDQYTVAFQSRLGPTPWIGPETTGQMTLLRQRGISRLAVICPSFTADCLETLEEMGIRAREQWMLAGGQSFELVPCLNSDPHWVNALAKAVQSSIA